MEISEGAQFRVDRADKNVRGGSKCKMVKSN